MSVKFDHLTRTEGKNVDTSSTPTASFPGLFGVLVGTGIMVYPAERLIPAQRVEYPHQTTLTGSGPLMPLMEPMYFPTTETNPPETLPDLPDQQ
jgi:hypothetical protein